MSVIGSDQDLQTIAVLINCFLGHVQTKRWTTTFDKELYIMNTKFFVTAAFAALLVPAIANAAAAPRDRFDPAATSNDPNFVQMFFKNSGANAAAAKADADRYAAAEQALKGSNGSSVLIGTHGSTGVAGAKLVTSYDPSAQTNDPQFPTTVVIENPANAAAAKADAERFARIENSAESGALIGTHGSVGVKAVTYYDPAAHTNDPQFSALPILVK